MFTDTMQFTCSAFFFFFKGSVLQLKTTLVRFRGARLFWIIQAIFGNDMFKQSRQALETNSFSKASVYSLLMSLWRMPWGVLAAHSYTSLSVALGYHLAGSTTNKKGKWHSCIILVSTSRIEFWFFINNTYSANI